MKTKVLFTLAILVSLLSANASEIVINSQDGARFYFILDGKVQNDFPQKSIRIQLPAGSHQFRVVFEQQYKSQLFRTFEVYPGTRSFYEIGWDRLILGIYKTGEEYLAGQNQSNQFIGNYVPSGYFCNEPTVSRVQHENILKKYRSIPESDKRDFILSTIVSNCWYSKQIAEIVSVIGGPNNKLEVAQIAYQHTYDTDKFDFVLDVLPAHLHEDFLRYVRSDIGRKRVAANQGQINNAQQNSYGTSSNKLNPESIRLIGEDIQSEAFTSGKLQVLNNALDGKTITCEQLKSLLEYIPFEEDKLNVVKERFSQISDPQNIDHLLDLFAFESSKDEVKKLVGR